MEDKAFVINILGGSHLFQRVASFLHQQFLYRLLLVLNAFSSLSESGFIPTQIRNIDAGHPRTWFSSLSESGFIPTSELHIDMSANTVKLFSSLSESGFIPTY